MRIYISIAALFILLSSCEKNSTNDEPTHKDPLKEGLIAHYPFNGNANDESGNEYHLTVKGASLSQDRFGNSLKSYRFNGTDQKMLIPKLAQGDNIRDFTISLWLKPEDFELYYALSFRPSEEKTACNADLRIERFGPLLPRINFNAVTVLTPTLCAGSSISDSITAASNTWLHFVVVQRYVILTTAKPRYEYTAYLGGKKYSQITGSLPDPTPFSFNHGGTLGCDVNEYYSYFKGSIDDLRIYNRPLTDEEVQQLYTLQN